MSVAIEFVEVNNNVYLNKFYYISRIFNQWLHHHYKSSDISRSQMVNINVQNIDCQVNLSEEGLKIRGESFHSKVPKISEVLVAEINTGWILNYSSTPRKISEEVCEKVINNSPKTDEWNLSNCFKYALFIGIKKNNKC